MKEAMAKAKVTEGFMNAVSPGTISVFQPNEYYPSHETYLEALANAMREEYELIVKSGLLLPKEEAPDPDPEALALRLQLRLQRLDAMREAGARLMAGDRLGRDVFRREAPEGVQVERRPLWQASLFDLLAAYGAVRRRGEPVVHMVTRRPVVTLEEALNRLERMLGERIDWAALEAFQPRAIDEHHRRSALASSFLCFLHRGVEVLESSHPGK